jgi:Protein of unknown function (DUF1580)
MIDQLLCETRISLAQLSQEQNKSLPTCWRWTQRGVKGHVLASFSCGGRRYTTREAFSRWISALNGAPIRSETPAAHERRLREAERRADEMGL